MPSHRRFFTIPAAGWVILALTFIATGFSGWWMQGFLAQRDQQELAFAASQITEKINQRLKTYALVLRSGAGLFAGSDQVTRDDWHEFFAKQGIAESVSGVRGFGFTIVVPPATVAQHQSRLRSEGFSDYTIYPAGERDDYTAIVFIEPLDAQNRQVLGYDMYAEPIRRAAMERARDTGRAALTAKLTLIQEADNRSTPGVLMYVPVYRNGEPHETPEQRRSALVGWVYGAFRVNELLEGLLEGWSSTTGVRRPLGVSIYDESEQPEALLFSNLPDNAEHDPALNREIRFDGQRWLLNFASLAPATSSLLTTTLVALGVFTLGLLILALYMSLVRTQGKARDIAERLTKDLRSLANQFDTIANRVPGMVYTYQLFPDGRSCFPYASRAMKDVYGVDPETVREDGEAIMRIIHPDDNERVTESILESARNLTPWQEEYRVIHPDGSPHWVIGNALPHKAEDGSVIWYGSLTRITARKEAESKLKHALAESARFRDALDRMDTFVFMKDLDLRYTYANQATLHRLGVTEEQLLGTRGELALDRISIDRINQLDQRVLRGARVTEEVEVNIRGERAMLLQIKTPIFEEEEDSNNIIGLIGISTDITKATQQAQEIERLAHYDALTGLPNRALLTDRLNQAMAMVERRQSALAVVYLDLDGFKAINDTYGHSAGDQVLITVAHRMREALRHEDTLSRLGGDEFVAVLIDMSPTRDYEHHLQRLLKAASEPILLKDKAVTVSASLGVTFFPQSEIAEGDQLIRQADQAMYQAKLAGKNRFHLFDTELDRSVRSQHETVGWVRRALSDGELCLFYQPKVNMRTSEVIGAEALLRWQHPERGLMAPGAFISLIENTPVMLEIGQWVMESALRQMNDWLEQGLRMPLSINISAIELRNPAFPEQLRKQLKAWPKVDPSMLELEVLETAALGDLGQISRVLESCRALGVSIAIDDFGTGYSSLTYFKRLPARVVKIDQSFVSGILRDPADLAILDGIVRLADALGRDLIAEGVETHAHAEMLLRIGCNMAQGYGVARPMPASEFLPWCRQWKAPERWRHLSVIPRRALPTMYAGVDHRAWLEHFRSYIQGNEDTIELNSALCGFGVWLEKQDKESPHLSNARKLHQEVHKVAEEIHKLFLAGSHNNIPGRMKELERLSDELYHEMELLMEQTA